MPPKRRSSSRSRSRSNSRGRSRSAPRTAEKSSGCKECCTFIPKKYLSNLKKYKYVGADSSFLSLHVMKHYWNWVIELVPLNVAPNMLTLTGFVVGMSSTLINLYYFYQDMEYPSWAWGFAAFCLFFYQTLDAIDGKQARRTGTGSPLGELFDHGCDAVITPFVQVNVCLSLSMPGWMRFLFLLMSTLGLFTSIWEQYVTGLLDLGFISGPTDGILLVCGIHIVTAVKGLFFWTTPLRPEPFFSYDLPISPCVARILPVKVSGSLPLSVSTPRDILFVFFGASWLVTVASNVMHALVRPSVHKDKGSALKTAIPTVLITVLHYTVFLSFPELQEQYPFFLELSYGLLISYTVTRLTISRLCRMPYKGHFLLFILNAIPSLAAVAYTLLPSFQERLSRELAVQYLGRSLIGLTIVGLLLYLVMAVSVFRQIARYLGINIMTIKTK